MRRRPATLRKPTRPNLRHDAMLKALELNGFKSFADRTRLAFDPGITVVVGPNGSGKSNVVDAIKWALGSQSVKALRGQEMSDVIFSGSAARRGANAAEVSLIFDNSAGLFDHEATEIELTRRVYRSGECEYLINRQPQRLRDMRDLLGGAGLSTSAYCVIEQGKVDALLQSSPKQRRVLFEEAAGVNRFKIKREEAARRLERVQQNLVRLKDLVEELDARLRTVRSQAGRAKKHQEVAERLKSLRVATALADYRGHSARLARLGAAGSAAAAAGRDLETQLQTCEAALAADEGNAATVQERLRAAAAADAALRERIAHALSTRSSQLARADELDREIERLAQQVLQHSTRAGDSQQLAEATAQELRSAQHALARLQQQVSTELSAAADLEQQLRRAAARHSEAHAALETADREALRLERHSELLAARRDAQTATATRCRQERAPLLQSAEKLHAEHQRLEAQWRQSHDEYDAAARRLAEDQRRLDANRTRQQSLLKQAAETRQQLAAARERTAVLDELERRLDGLTAGARAALQRAEDDPQGPFGDLHGVVADLLQVDADFAPMIEVALGDRAHHLVALRSDRLCRELAANPIGGPGRLGVIRLDVPAPASAMDRVDLSQERGVIGRADLFAETASEVEGLPRRLLGRTWLVETLADALRLADERGRGLNFVTATGEILGADGTLVAGPRPHAVGLLSRRSELRALREQIVRLELEAEQQTHDCDSIEQLVNDGQSALRTTAERAAELQQQAMRSQLEAAAAHRRAGELQTRLDALTVELTAVEQATEAAAEELAAAERRLAALASQRNLLQQTLREAATTQTQLASQLAVVQQQLTEHRVGLAGAEQRTDGLQRQTDQLLRDRQERDAALRDMQQRGEECRRQRAAILHATLELSSELAELYRRRDVGAATAAELSRQHADSLRLRGGTARQADELRQALLDRERRTQQSQLQLQQLEMERIAVAERLAQEYGLDLAALAAESTPLEQTLPPEGTPPPHDASPSRDEVDREIRDLRQRLQAAGPVNLEALEELAALEERHAGMASQFEDLEKARQRLTLLVNQISSESQQLFSRTLDEIRGHFQQIFTTLFGGGNADIVVEQEAGDDLLECGINIVARPPGKQPRSISLLSGGERTLTCVALLLAVFRSRPSPFCVLDEVDAALDEANIDRFVNVIRDFMKSTQFIVITHSKRTMSCSDTLYGITMQESGVSKRVSVRFEDIGEDGRIRSPARRADEPPSSLPARHAA